ncbi:hypothetical protein [Actinomadura gamaensis]|uniref:Uncharacterized protein n=1 Tax=Actinomadura gamaensis TaxID=1763541 RepID=A0ABV9TRF6_9ACTN
MGFMRIKNTGFSAAIVHPAAPWRAMFVRGDRVAVTAADGTVTEGPIQDCDWGDFRYIDLPYKDVSEGAVALPLDQGSGQMLLFKLNWLLHFHWTRGTLAEKYALDFSHGGPTLNTLLPAGYRDQIDALLMDSVAEGAPWRTHVFKRDRVATIDWAAGCTRDVTILEGVQPTAGWPRLAPEWSSDFDHVLPLPDADGGARRTLFVKGSAGCVFNWETGPESTGELTSLLPQLARIPAPYTTQYRPVSGRWTGSAATSPAGPRYEATIRLDLDGPTSTQLVSGDFFDVSGGTRSYAASFKCKPEVSGSPNGLVIKGIPSWSSDIGVYHVRIVVPRVAATEPASPAMLDVNRPMGTDYPDTLTFESRYFRTVELETDTMAGRAAFASYDTSRRPVPPGYANRRISVVSAFAEAGIEMRPSAATDQIGADESGADLLWSTAELHTAMVAHFAGYADSPQWRMWTFVASRYVDTGVVGTMFDRIGRNRQGMAVFHDAEDAAGELGTYEEPHTYVHELGHTFNLVHSWDKARVGARLGPFDGYGDLSWMNYPHLYRDATSSGTGAYWARFRFRFSDDELAHLRHAYYDAIVPGGADFFVAGSSAKLADDRVTAAMSEPLADDSGLVLTLSARPFLFGEPVLVEARLSRDGRDVSVHSDLSPAAQNLRFAITAPSGGTRLFRPLFRVCSGHDGATMTRLTVSQPAVYASAYLGSGADGPYFTDPGLYRVRAVYTAPDGSRVVSNTLPGRVRLPITPADQDAGELLMGDEAGTVVGLLGSDSPSLQAGNDALSELSSRFAGHPLAVYSHLAQGANAGRSYQHITGGRIRVRPPDTKDASAQLSAAIDASMGPHGLNDITLNAAMRRLAAVHAKAGEPDQADAVLSRMVEHFRARHVPPHVLATIRAQANATREQYMPNRARTPRKRS